MNPTVSFECASGSAVGRRRTANEDTVLVDAELGLLVVCDGVGGRDAGEVASQRAAAEMHRIVRSLVNATAPAASIKGEMLYQALRTTNEFIVALAGQQSEWRDMSTTCVALLVADDGVVVGHAGDSRCYRIDGHGALRLTSDHTTDEIARRFFAKSGDGEQQELSVSAGVLVQALGKDTKSFRASIGVHSISAGDTFLLCSDGLTNELTDGEIASIVSQTQSLDEASTQLINGANEHGGRDNISVALLRITNVPATRAEFSGFRKISLLDWSLWIGSTWPAMLSITIHLVG